MERIADHRHENVDDLRSQVQVTSDELSTPVLYDEG
jgi:hypothetical protein